MSDEQKLERSEVFSFNPTTQRGLVISRRRRDVECVEVLTSELESIGSANSLFTIFAALDGLAFGLLITALTTLLTVPFSPSQVLIYAGFVAALLVAALAVIVFSVLSLVFWIRSRSQIRKILGTREEIHQQTEVIMQNPPGTPIGSLKEEN